MALGILQRAKLGEVGEDPEGSRFKVVRLTPLGRRAREAHVARLREVDVAGVTRAPGLREVLVALVGGGRWREGLEPPTGSWRAKVPPPDTLPAYPMVLHRGGYPDGS